MENKLKELERLEVVKTFSKNIVLFSDDEIKKQMIREFKEEIDLLEKEKENLSSVVIYQDKQIKEFESRYNEVHKELDRMELAIVFVVGISLVVLMIGFYEYLC